MARPAHRSRSFVERQKSRNSDSDDELFLPVRPHSSSMSSWTPATATTAVPNTELKSPSSFTGPCQHGEFDLAPQPRERSESIQSNSSIVDGLLFEIYDRWHYPRRDSLDSDTFTECSSTSEAFFGRSDSCHLVFQERHARRYHRAFLEEKGKLMCYLCSSSCGNYTNNVDDCCLKWCGFMDPKKVSHGPILSDHESVHENSGRGCFVVIDTHFFGLECIELTEYHDWVFIFVNLSRLHLQISNLTSLWQVEHIMTIFFSCYLQLSSLLLVKCHDCLTHWDPKKRADILQKHFLMHYCQKTCASRLKFHWGFPRVQLTISHLWFRWGLGADDWRI